jgi:hypothetical protein
MATEVARLEHKELQEEGTQTDLTLTGLLMEGVNLDTKGGELGSNNL